jgi:hypothetical protein
MGIEARIATLERKLGKQVMLRGVRTLDSAFRGRVLDRAHCLVIEYRDDAPGYFWQYEIVEELLDRVERGERTITLFEGGVEYVEAAARRHFKA